MTFPIVIGMVAVLIVLWLLTRNSAKVKKAAREDLEREMEALPHRDILDLVREEAEETGVADIPGADGVDIPVRLKVWHRDAAVRAACPDPAMLVFVLAEGVHPEHAEADDLRLHFDGHVPAPQPPEAADRGDAAEDEGVEGGA